MFDEIRTIIKCIWNAMSNSFFFAYSLILLDNLLTWCFQVMLLLIVVPKKLKCSTF